MLVLCAGSRVVKSGCREAESPSAESRSRRHAGSRVTAEAFVNGRVWPAWNRGPGAGAEWGARSRRCVRAPAPTSPFSSEPPPPPPPSGVSPPCVSSAGGSGGGHVGDGSNSGPVLCQLRGLAHRGSSETPGSRLESRGDSSERVLEGEETVAPCGCRCSR